MLNKISISRKVTRETKEARGAGEVREGRSRRDITFVLIYTYIGMYVCSYVLFTVLFSCHISWSFGIQNVASPLDGMVYIALLFIRRWYCLILFPIEKIRHLSAG